MLHAEQNKQGMKCAFCVAFGVFYNKAAILVEI